MLRRLALAMLTTSALFGCSSNEAPAPSEPVASSSSAITTTDVIARAQQWVDAKLQYCQAPNHQHDYDTACSSTCNRQDNPEWDPYRSDCSGFVSWAWGLPAPGRVTSQFAPANTAVSHEIQGTDLQPGDALNYPADHIILFVKWITPNKQAEFFEEPGCGVSIPYAHAFTSNVSINGSSVYVSYEGMTFTAIRYNAIQDAPPMMAHRGAVDINGDGKSDVCGRASDGVLCRINGVEVKGPAWSDAAGWDAPQYYRTIQFADVDGDGRGDICARDSQGIVCEISNGNGFSGEIRGPAWSDTSGWANPQYYSTIQFVDVNGDGKADVCARAAAGLLCSLSDGKGFPTAITGPAWSDANGWADPQYYSTIQFVDVNGDGKADVCGRASDGILCSISDGNGFPKSITGPAWSTAGGWGAPQYDSTIRWGDIDGDGKVDVCGRAVVGVVCSLSDGNGFPTAVQGPAWSDANGWSASQFYSTIQLADVNGDGKQDICARAAAGVLCELSDGKGFPTEVVGPAWSSAGGWDDPQYDSTLGFADLDNDGKDDVCARGWDGVFCALSTGTGFADAQLGPAWSNPNGWGVEKYYGTLRYTGTKPKKAPPPPSPGSGNDAGATSDGGGASGGGSTGGCSMTHDKESGAAGWLVMGLALALSRLKRRRASPSRFVS